MQTTNAENWAVRFYRTEPKLYEALLHSKRLAGKLGSAADDAGAQGVFADAATFSELRSLVGGLNVFECLNTGDYEARHSNLLAWLIDPAGTHGLAARPLQSFFALIGAASAVGQKPERVEVVRERGRVDLFAVDHEARCGLVLENKVHSGEHSRQLQRYREKIEAEFPHYQFQYVFLTPGETAPSDGRYVALSYERVADWLATLVPRVLAEPADADLVTMLCRHYVQFSSAVDAPASRPRLNLFHALRLREIRHSDFWGWLLSPGGSHGLGERPIRELLRLLSERGDTAAGSLLALPEGSLADVLVHREVNDSDLLLVSEEHQWACLIEMKVPASESAGQLGRYRRFLEGWFPEFRRSLVFMSLSGVKASEADFRSISFRDWVPFMEQVTGASPEITHDAELACIIAQYRQMLLCRLTSFESTIPVLPREVRSVAVRLWEQHGSAIRRMLETVAEWQKRAQRELEEFIGETVEASLPGGCFRPGRFPGSFACYMPFVPREWEAIPSISVAGGDPAYTGQLVNLTLLNFPFTNPFQNAENMGLTLVIGLTKAKPGYEGLREVIYEEARGQRDLFNAAVKAGAGSRGNVRLGVHALVSWEECRVLPMEEVKGRFRRRWERFVRDQYPRITSMLQAEPIRAFRG